MVREDDTGKRKRSSSVQQNNRIGERIIIRDPKIRKAKPEESRKCKARKLRHVEEQQPMDQPTGKREEEIRAAFVKGMTERQVAFYKTVVAEDYGRDIYLTEDMIPYYPFGPDEARELNDYARKSVREFKEHAAARLKEYEETGCLEGFPPASLTSDAVSRIVNGK